MRCKQVNVSWLILTEAFPFSKRFVTLAHSFTDQQPKLDEIFQVMSMVYLD